MNRLSLELNRLYAAAAPDPADGDPPLELFDIQGRVRALVLELGRPADWLALSAVWQGVQADLGLPAPAIVVQGVDAYQLWFSLAEPLAAQAGHGFLLALAARYLGDLGDQAPRRLRLMPALDPALPLAQRHAAWVPQAVAEEQWSAFVSADLAPVFSETPWLDLAPGRDGQAGLLAGLKCIQPDALHTALARLKPALVERTAVPASGDDPAQPSGAAAATSQQEPEQFLRGVMNDSSVALALRIEAAKALLPFMARR